MDLETQEGENMYTPFSSLFMSPHESSRTFQLKGIVITVRKPPLYRRLTRSQYTSSVPQEEFVFLAALGISAALQSSDTHNTPIFFVNLQEPALLLGAACAQTSGCPAQKCFLALKKDVSPGSLKMHTRIRRRLYTRIRSRLASN